MVENIHLKTRSELEEEKKQDSFESVLVFQSLRKNFFRKMLRFMNKHIIKNLDFKTYPYISIQISNSVFVKFINSLNAIVSREEAMSQ